MRTTLPALLGLLLIAASCTQGDDGSAPSPRPTPAASPSRDARPIPDEAYLRSACDLPPEWVLRIHRGWAPGRKRDDDLVIVPKPPNYMGTFINTSHSAPYAFLQNVPLILYGPGIVPAQGHVEIDREVTIADLAPTYAHLMSFDGWPARNSAPLVEVVNPGETPRLIVTAVIDGGGWNALRHWADTWPEMQRLIDEGVNVRHATVGSSPSITPATHTNLSTGTFPRFHGVTAIAVRSDDGAIVGSFSESPGNPGPAVMDPTISLRKTTLADLWDRTQDNRPLVGMVAAGNLQLGMVGHGSALDGGDQDIVAILSKGVWATNPAHYALPAYVNDPNMSAQPYMDAVDRADGAADGRWLGHELDPIDTTPAFAPWQNRVMFELMEREGFGRDRVTDLFYINYKAPDKAGHKWNMVAEEQGEVLRSVDEAIGELVDWLDSEVGEGRYLLAITADHGQTPLGVGGWPIGRSELMNDLTARFDTLDNGRNVIQRTSASSFFARVDEMEANGVSSEQIASFLSRYTIGDNIPDGDVIPPGFEARTDERIFDAVFPGRRLPEIMACTGARDAG